MKTGNHNIAEIEEWLDRFSLEPNLSDDFVRRVYAEVQEPYFAMRLVENVKQRNMTYSIAYDYVRRDLLKIIYKRNDFSATGIAAGFVYAIRNPAWPEYTKIGCAIDVPSRLTSYQTSSPHRDYVLVDYYFGQNRLVEEKKIHSLFERNGEWCKVSSEAIKALFKQKKVENHVEVLPEKLYEVKDKIAEKKVLLQEQLEKEKTLRRTAKLKRKKGIITKRAPKTFRLK